MRFRDYPELRSKLIELVRNPTRATHAIENGRFQTLPLCQALHREARKHDNANSFLSQAFGKVSTSIDRQLQDNPPLHHAGTLLDIMHEANECVEQQGGQRPTNPYSTGITVLTRISMEGLPAEELADTFIDIYQHILDFRETYGPTEREMKQTVRPIVESMIYYCYDHAMEHEQERYGENCSNHDEQKKIFIDANDRICAACTLVLEDSRIHQTPTDAPYQPADRAVIIGSKLIFEYENAQGRTERRYYPLDEIKKLMRGTIGPLHIDDI